MFIKLCKNITRFGIHSNFLFKTSLTKTFSNIAVLFAEVVVKISSLVSDCTLKNIIYNHNN